MQRDLVEAVTSRAEALLAEMAGAREGQARATHRARVAARRLAEVLPLVGGAGQRLARRVREIRRALGAGREVDVTIEVLRHESAAREWSQPLVKRLQIHLETERDRRVSEASKVLDRWDGSRLRRRLRAVGEKAAEVRMRDLRAPLLARQVLREQRLEAAAAKAGALYDVDRLHAVRVAVKKYRYVLEVGADLLGQRNSRRLAQLKALQERLGDLHDLQVLLHEIRSYETTLTPGRGHVARALAHMANDVEADCRRLHGRVVGSIGELTS